MRIGIVGSEAAKFTPRGASSARTLIRSLLQPGDEVVSGGCHLGGIDIWAVEEAHMLDLYTHQYLPAGHSWEYYKERNILIAENSDHVVCLTVNRLSPAFQFPPQMKNFDGYCYHCKTDAHIKSGGCWTVKYAKKIGIPGDVLVVEQ